MIEGECMKDTFGFCVPGHDNKRMAEDLVLWTLTHPCATGRENRYAGGQTIGGAEKAGVKGTLRRLWKMPMSIAGLEYAAFHQ